MLKINLHDNWNVREYPQGSWHKAKIPGNVALDLQNDGTLPELTEGLNELCPIGLQDKNWQYAMAFDVSADWMQYSNVDLVLEGLDTVAQVSLNAVAILETQNMFRQYRVPVKSLLRTGENRLELFFYSTILAADRKAKEFGEVCYFTEQYLSSLNRMHLRKPGYHFVSDFGAPICTLPGVCGKIYLHAYNAGYIQQPFCKILKFQQDQIQLKIGGWVKVDSDSLTLECSLDGKLAGCVSAKDLSTVDIFVNNPRLWWPAGMGEQNRYDLKLVLKSGETIIDQTETQVGLRQIELVRKPDEWGESFHFRINGIEKFICGANWVPPDSYLPKIDESKVEELLTLVRDANINLLRVWGGGIYETDTFYKLCDRLGIMVWQDFTFFCAEYPETLDFQQEIIAEAIENVKRLQHHPSLAIWCGNNENQLGFDEWGWHEDRLHGEIFYNKILPQIVDTYDQTRPFWPGSPCGTNKPNDLASGDAHLWDVMSKLEPIEWYKDHIPRFAAEFGFFAWPEMPSVQKMIKNPEVASATSYELTTHTKARIGNYLQIKYLEKYFPKWQTFEQYIAFSGLLQGMALEYAINHWRTTWPRCGGTMIWQLNDSWPAGSWSFIDYYRRPKTAYYFVQRIYRPVTIQVVENTLFVSNDLNEIIDEKLNCRIYRLDGTLQEEKSYLITVPAHQVRSIVQLSDAAKLPGSVVDCSIDATSFQTHATTMIGWPKQWTIPIKPEYDISYDGELLTISTSGVIPFLMIDAEQSQENYLTIVPQKTYRIKVRGLRKLYDIFRNTDLHFRS